MERRHGWQRGSLQIWVENADDETTRRKRNLEPPDLTRWSQQRATRIVFDALIYNRDRNQGNLLIDPDWNVWLVDHTRAFGVEARLDAPEKLTGCPAPVWERLRPWACLP